jgi:hypothetical protein
VNTSVAVPIYFHTIVSNVHARLDAYICHNDSAAHEIVMKGDALIHAKISRIRSPMMLYLRFYQCCSSEKWQPTSILSDPTTMSNYSLISAMFIALDTKR